jgi:hypothetical protein
MSSADKSATAVLGNRAKELCTELEPKALAMGAGAHENVSVFCVTTLTKESS